LKRTGDAHAAAAHVIAEASNRHKKGQRLRLTVLGATGSIGTSTLDLVREAPENFEILALTANENVRELAALAKEFQAQFAVIADPQRYFDLCDALAGTGIAAGGGPNAIVEAAEMPADCVVAAIMGAAGLHASLAVLRRGGRLALANKECLVCAGSIFMDAAARSQGDLVPVDSEHSAIFQALAGHPRESVEKVTITASGGPFRTWSCDQIAGARLEDALKHPNWSMGRKITIDSATMMNKGLELIEAHYLFDLSADELDVVVHPQSIVHSLVSYADGSVLAQLGMPDMRTPIACALTWPQRMFASAPRLDLVQLQTLTFEAPDEIRFPALRLARDVILEGGTAAAILNAANEVAVSLFLERRLAFPDIAEMVARSLERSRTEGLICRPDDLSTIVEVDRRARDVARDVIARHM